MSSTLQWPTALHIDVRPLSAGELNAFIDRFDHQIGAVHRARFAQQLRGEARYLVAWDGGEMAGHVLLLWRAPDRIAPAAAGALLELKDVYTHPDRRRRGVGHALIRAAEREARTRGIERLGLGVAPDNLPAIRLYELNGFEPLDHPAFETYESCVDEHGALHEWRETVVYLTKDLP